MVTEFEHCFCAKMLKTEFRVFILLKNVIFENFEVHSISKGLAP